MEKQYAYRQALREIAEGLNELMADLEDIRDEAQECLDDQADPAIQADITLMDKTLNALDQAAELLDAQE